MNTPETQPVSTETLPATAEAQPAGTEAQPVGTEAQPVGTEAQPVDTRVDLPLMADERVSLDSWVDFYRETLLLKLDGLDAQQLCRRAVPPSALSPIGILRHLTDVEAYWLREVLLDDEQPDPHCSAENPNGDFDDVDPATALADIEAYRRELDATRAAQASWTDLDRPAHGLRGDEQVNLRWILTHLIEEYARHLGHLDLLREAIDGSTGY